MNPNILFILMDNLGYGEVGCYGGGILRRAPTPNIDRLAREGTKLLNFNVEPQCTPSRSCVMTGRHSIRSGTHSVPPTGGPYGLVQWEETIAKILSAQGCATGHFGKWHLGNVKGRPPTDQGSTSGTAFPTQPMRRCGRLSRASIPRASTKRTYMKAKREARHARSTL